MRSGVGLPVDRFSQLIGRVLIHKRRRDAYTRTACYSRGDAPSGDTAAGGGQAPSLALVMTQRCDAVTAAHCRSGGAVDRPHPNIDTPKVHNDRLPCSVGDVRSTGVQDCFRESQDVTRVYGSVYGSVYGNVMYGRDLQVISLVLSLVCAYAFTIGQHGPIVPIACGRPSNA